MNAIRNITLSLICALLCCAGCAEPRVELTQKNRDEIEQAVKDIASKEDKITWHSLDIKDLTDEEVTVEGVFWSTLKKHDTRLAHRVNGRFRRTDDALTSLTVDGFTYQKHPTTGLWWDGKEEEEDPEEHFNHLTDQEKNELWWEIDSRVSRDRHKSSTTITWQIDYLVKLISRYDVTPRQLTHFFEYGVDAPWRTETPPDSPDSK